MRRWANLVSYALHPAIMPLMGFGFLLQLHPFPVEREVLIYTTLFLLTGTYMLPGFISLLLQQMGLIPSLKMEEASARRWPFIIGFLFYLFTSIYLRSFPIPQETGRYIMGAAVSIGMLTVLLPYTKASAHMAGVGGLLALVFFISDAYGVDLLIYQAAGLLMCGAVGSARLALNAHTKTEIVLGFLCGFGGTSFALYFL